MNGFDGHPVTRVHSGPGGYDTATGDPVESTDTETVIEGCLWWPREMVTAGVGEPHTPGRNGVVVGLVLILPAGSDATEADEFIVDGDRFTVEGMPGRWLDPDGGDMGCVQVALKRAVG